MSFFKTICFISDLNLRTFFGTLVEFGDDAGGILILNFFTFFFTYFPPALKDPKSPSPTFAFALKFRGYVGLYTCITFECFLYIFFFLREIDF